MSEHAEQPAADDALDAFLRRGNEDLLRYLDGAIDTEARLADLMRCANAERATGDEPDGPGARF